VRTGFEGNLSRRYAAEVPGALDVYRRRALAVKMPVPVMLMQWEAALAHDTTARLGEIAVPVLILHGTADAGIPVSNAYRLSELMPAAKVELFDDAGHLFWWEDPGRTVELISAHG